MSTKIYDGIYLDNMTLTELNDWCLTTRKSLKDIALAQYFRGVIHIAAAIFIWQKTDMNLCPYYNGLNVQKLQNRKDDPKQWDARSVFAYADRIAKNIAKLSAAAKNILDNEPDFDYNTSISIFPIADKILAIPYTTNEALKSRIMNDTKVHEYGYWNNSDHPSGLTDEDWNMRERDWNYVFKNSGIPANCGMSVQLLDLDSLEWWVNPDKAFVEKYVKPHLKEEIEYCELVAKQKLIDAMWEDIKKKKNIDGHEMSTCLEIHKHFKEHPELVFEEAKKYVGTLDFAAFMLRGLPCD